MYALAGSKFYLTHEMLAWMFATLFHQLQDVPLAPSRNPAPLFPRRPGDSGVLMIHDNQCKKP